MRLSAKIFKIQTFTEKNLDIANQESPKFDLLNFGQILKTEGVV